MRKSTPLSAQQGLAYVVATHGVLLDASKHFKCPQAQVLTLLGLQSVNEAGILYASTRELQQVVHLSLPLLRGYVRALETAGYVQRERLYRRGAQLLRLTVAGESVVGYCQRELRRAAARVLEWRQYQ